MGRRGRTEQKGMFFHVIQRGNNREYVFKEEIDKGYLIKQFKHYKEGLGYKIYGFVIMDNHYHFIIQTLSEKLQAIMHRVNSKYSRYYNYRYKHSGHVFQGRYKAKLVQEEKYLLGLLRYIHQNPMRANMVSCISEYKWSSDIQLKGTVPNDLKLWNL